VGSTRRRFTPEYKAEAVQFVLSSGQPVAEVARNLGVIFHSDRGTQYTSTEFRAFCHTNNVRPSVGRTAGVCGGLWNRVGQDGRDVVPATETAMSGIEGMTHQFIRKSLSMSDAPQSDSGP
jgi:Transposase